MGVAPKTNKHKIGAVAIKFPEWSHLAHGCDIRLNRVKITSVCV